MSRPVVYVVTMYRWGNRENHSYVHGVYSTKTKAETAASEETGYRGGKYFPEVLEVPVNHGGEDHNFKVTVELGDRKRKEVPPPPELKGGAGAAP